MSTPMNHRCRKRCCRCPMSSCFPISAAPRLKHGAPWGNSCWIIWRPISVTAPCLPRSDSTMTVAAARFRYNGRCQSPYRTTTMPAAIRWITTVLMTLALQTAIAQSQPGFLTETVVEDIPVPWGMTWLPDGDMLVTERSGRLYRVHEGQPTSIAGLPQIHVSGQGGLLDIALHPDYPDNGGLYFSYPSPEGTGEGSNTALMRAQLQGDSLVNQQVLYKAEPNSTRGQHYGSRILFDRDGYLFYSVGDRGAHFENAQQLDRDGGKIYRLNDDGSVPSGNPFVNTPGAIAALWSYGH